MKPLHPAYYSGNTNYPVFVEKVMGDVCQCISLNRELEKVERSLIDTALLVNAFDVRTEIRLEHLDLWFKVKSIDKTISMYGDNVNPGAVLNSVLPMICMTNALINNQISYKIRSGGKNFWFHPIDIVYLPMLNNGAKSLDNLHIGCKVTSIVDNPCHNLIKGAIYEVKEITMNRYSFFDGTVYIENTITGEKGTTYPKYLKLIMNESI